MSINTIDALMKRLGPNAHPFTMEMTPLAPPSVQLVPAKEYSGAPIGTSYDVRAYIGEIYCSSIMYSLSYTLIMGALYVCVWWGGGGKDATTREKEREDDELTLMWASLSCNLLSIDLMVPRYPPAPLEGRQLSAWRNSSNKERSESSMKIYELTRV
uniref:Uncharacterized protein n=1 Tax=Timema tahoe TaxID=61484 RepID=A0A7R9IDV9_9NEOP|nr:unnamed protein product [Timema tahoe]